MYDSIKTQKGKKTVIITGGLKGIGLSITKAFLDEGYIVIVGSRNYIKRFDDKNLIFVETDVRFEDHHFRLVNEARMKTGRLDVYINNAGFSEWRPISQIDNDFLNNIFDTNLKSAFWGAKASIDFFEKNGVIINISSIAGKRGSKNNSAYSASKFAMNGLTQSLSKEFGPKGVRVNAVCPVLVDTDGLLEALGKKESPCNGNPQDFIKDFAKNNSALIRMPTGEEIADMCIFLASSKASAITGQCINVDCGVLPQ